MIGAPSFPCSSHAAPRAWLLPVPAAAFREQARCFGCLVFGLSWWGDICQKSHSTTSWLSNPTFPTFLEDVGHILPFNLGGFGTSSGQIADLPGRSASSPKMLAWDGEFCSFATSLFRMKEVEIWCVHIDMYMYTLYTHVYVPSKLSLYFQGWSFLTHSFLV